MLTMETGELRTVLGASGFSTSLQGGQKFSKYDRYFASVVPFRRFSITLEYNSRIRHRNSSGFLTHRLAETPTNPTYSPL
ncbi:hypothetical protein E5288_WYG008733 [Bos mutus]|uniref:Uncharacterized protein n=1 Tax=Bos mutus TaxID=72004 RepID=A0A6B0SA37_9CETA|nr:hypothetical protein [Bos mutus]